MDPESTRNSDRTIAVAHFMPWSGIGGVEVATLRLAEATRNRIRHIAFCLDDATALRSSFEKLGVEVITYAAPTPSIRHATRFYKESRVVARQIRQAGAHIVHFADLKAAYHNSLAALLARSKTVCHVRVSYPRLELRERLCLLPVQSFIFVSNEAKQTFGITLPPKKARVIYDAVEVSTGEVGENVLEVRRELGVPDGCAVVGQVARVSAQKDYFTFAEAAKHVLERFPDTRFLVVGDNSLVDLNRQHYVEVSQKLTELGIRDRFIFTGHTNNVPRFVSAMDVCVLCTHREGFPLSILETMAMGKPVIATAVGGIPEIVIPGVTGYLHRHGDSQELADAIVTLIENPSAARSIGKSAYEHVRKHYSRQIFADEISTAYLDLMQR
ncbi:MAG: glycosyltransferase [Acidobacteriota bacterium]|nr:glycosyltransferase [Acidobacteriota bacterium]